MEGSQNNKGEYALYDNGKLLRYEGVSYVDGKKIINSYLPFVKIIIEAANKDTIITKAIALKTIRLNIPTPLAFRPEPPCKNC